MSTKNKNNTPAENRDQQNSSELYERTGSTEHNDYRITGKNDGTGEKKDEKDSYQDYNGNSEVNNPARTGK